jgi:hypothetical protein
MKAQRKKRNTDPEHSDGEVAWRNRYVDLYEMQCAAYDKHNECLEALDASAVDRAVEILEGLVASFEEDVRQLVK